MKRLRRFLVIGVMVLSTIAMSGLLIAPSAKASASAGDLIKMSGLSSVYYLGSDNKRYVFPNESTYFSWYRDFSGVVTISASELQSYPIGGNVTMRAGTKLVKITTDPSVYAVEPNGVLRKIQTEAQAAALFGTNWSKRVVDVSDAFFVNYSIGAVLPNGNIPAGTLVKNANVASIYYYDGTNYRNITTEAAFNANRFNFGDVITITNAITAGGTAVTSAEFINAAQNGSIIIITGSGLMVSLSAVTPAASAVPTNAVNVPYTKINFTAASDGPVTLNSVAFTRSGIGSGSDFVNVYLYDGATRLTTGRTVNSSTNKATFTGLNVTIPAGTTKTLTLTADISTGGNNDAFGIAAAADILSTGANVTGSFPVTGSIMNIVSQSTGGITIAKTGTISNPMVGDTSAKVASFTLAASSVENLSVEGLTLYQAGGIANSNLTNFVLKQGTTIVATASGVNTNNNIVFTFSSVFNIDKGISKTFDVYATIGSGARSGDTIYIYLDNAADLLARGLTYGYGVGVTRTAYDNSAGNGTDASWSTIQAGQITLSFQGPALADYAVQQQGVELFRFNMTSQSNVEVRKMVLNLTASSSGTGGLIDSTASTSNYTNIKFVDATTGALIAGPMDIVSTGSDTTQSLSFTDVWNMTSGQTRTIKVLADIANFVPMATEVITAKVIAFGASDIRNLDNNTFVPTASIVPTGDITGNAMNVKSSSATLTLAGTPGVQTYINGSTNVPMVGINVAAGSGKDITVTSAKFTAVGTGDCTTGSNCVLTVKLFDGAAQVGLTKSLVSSDSTVTFDNLAVAVAKGTTKTLVAYVDLNTLTMTTSTTLRLDVATAGDFVAQDATGNSVAITSTVTGPAQIISGAGSLTTVKSAAVIGSTDSLLVAAGNIDQPIASFKFTASNEALKLNKIRVKIQAETFSASSSATTEIANVSLWNGATQIGSQTVPYTDGTFAVADFNTTMNDFIVAKDSSADLMVKVSYNTVSLGARAGIKLTAYVDGSTANFQFRGTNSQTVVSKANSNGLDIAGNLVVLFKTIPTITNGTLPTSVLAAGNQVLGRISVAADAKGNVDWTQLIFTYSASNATATNFTLVDEGNNSVATCTDSSGTVTCTSSVDNTVAAGTSKTYSFKSDLTVGTNSASVSTHVLRQNTFANMTTNASSSPSSNFNWSDESVVAHNIASSADYASDYLVSHLPLDSQTLSK